jgi:hypothetical protein
MDTQAISSAIQNSQRSSIGRSLVLVVVVSVMSCSALLIGIRLGRQTGNPPLPQIMAAAAVSSDNMAVATGPIGRDSEGIFFLDFITGDLQCLVYYPRIGAFGAHYYANVVPQLGGGGGRNAKYLMVTGQAIVPGSTGGARPAASLVYVTDTTTGIFAAYAVPWDPTAESAGRPQSGPLRFVGGGPIRNYQLADPGNNQPAAIVDPLKK